LGQTERRTEGHTDHLKQRFAAFSVSTNSVLAPVVLVHNQTNYTKSDQVLTLQKQEAELFLG